MTTHLDAVNTAHYTYRVSWSAEDGEFVATCLEFPSLSWLASTQVKALSGIRKLVDEVFADLVASGEDPPVPLAERHYSGRFNVRISPDLHRELTIRAADQHMSLNRMRQRPTRARLSPGGGARVPIAVALLSGLAQTRRLRPSVSFGRGPFRARLTLI